MEKSKLSDELHFLDRYRDEIKPVVAAEEAVLLDHLYEGVLTQDQIEKILKEQETKVFMRERLDAAADAIKVLLVGRDPGTGLGLKTLLQEMEREKRVGAVGVLVDGVAQQYLREDLKEFRQLDESPLVIPDIIRSADRPYDVIVNTISIANNPASVTFMNEDLLSHDRPDAKSYLVYEGYEFNVSQDYYREVENLDGVFCNDALAKEILLEKFPKLDPDRIFTTGTGQTDSIQADRAEELYRSGRKKLELSEDVYTVVYLGTISSEYQTHELDHEVDEKSWLRTVKTLAGLAAQNPHQQFALLYRYHPRDPHKEETYALAGQVTLPENLVIKKATGAEGLSVDEAVYASNAIASMTLTENFKALHRKRQGIYLGFEDPGMGFQYLQRNYSPEIIESMESKGGMKIVHTDTELISFLESIKDLPLEQPVAKPGETSAARMLRTILKDQGL